MQSSKKHLKQHRQSTTKEQCDIECPVALETSLSKQKIIENYQEKSRTLHQGAVQTHNTLSRQLTELLHDTLYHDSYRILARMIGLNGITADVGKYVSIDSPYNVVQPLISYSDLYTELERQHKKKECSALITDFYLQSPEQSPELNDALRSPALHNYAEPIWHKSPWNRAFSRSMTSIHGFRDHVHSVMTKYNIRLAKEHGWESMPLTKMHLYRSNHTGGSPLDQTPWGILNKEYRDMMSTICSAYYQREAQLKKERDDALLDIDGVYEITEDYQEKSRTLHQGAVQTYNTLSRQLTESLHDTLYHDSYRILARMIGLNGITADVGKYVSIDSPYNVVQPLISYSDLYTELERQHKKKECSALITDFYLQSPEQSPELNDALRSPALHNYAEPIWHKSPWNRAFSRSMTSIHGFRDHVHSVMTKYNIRLAKEHGWESMPLTKMHLYRSNHTGGSPLDQTPWGILNKEYRDMMSTICSAYYQREAQLKKEHDDTLLKIDGVYETTIEETEKKLHTEDEMDWEELNALITAESKVLSEQQIEPPQKSTVPKKIRPEINKYEFFGASSKPKLTTIYEDQEEHQSECEEDEDPEICAIFSSSIQLQKTLQYRK